MSRPSPSETPALLNATGVREPFGLRSVVEVIGANGIVGLGETYDEAVNPALIAAQAKKLIDQHGNDVTQMKNLNLIGRQSCLGFGC